MFPVLPLCLNSENHIFSCPKRQPNFAFIAGVLMMNDFVRGLRYFWIVVSALILLGLLSLLVLPEQTILHNLPVCVSIRILQKPCFCCGMSRAFLALKDGNLHRAVEFNHWSVPLFILLISNETLCGYLLLSRRIKKAITRR
jgi:hypothetical protein